jgi:hypothetical protein
MADVFTFTSDQVAALNNFHQFFPEDGALEDVYRFIAKMFRKAFSTAEDASRCVPMWDDVWLRLADFLGREVHVSQKRHLMSRILYYYAFPGEGLYNMMYYKRLEDGTIVRDMERNWQEGRLYRTEIMKLVQENDALKKKLAFIAEVL